MHLDFTDSIARINADGGFGRIANQVRPGDEYLFASLLPERNHPDYYVESGSMTIRSLMPGLVGTDSVYPPTGYGEMESEVFKTLKVANEVTMGEQAQRTLGAIAKNNGFNGVEEVLNFYDKLILQPHIDLAEWMRGQALVNAGFTWTFGDNKAVVSFTRPSGYDLTARTGTAAYNSSASMFWTDVFEARRLLRNKLAGIVMNQDMYEAITTNSANELIVTEIGDDGSSATLRKTDSTGNEWAMDQRYIVNVTIYDGAAEVASGTPGTNTTVPFMPDGKVLFVGQRPSKTAYRVGDGSTQNDETLVNSLGYTHIAPTVEAGGTPGRWGRVYTPVEVPWQLKAQGVANLVPVIENPKLIVVASSTTV